MAAPKPCKVTWCEGKKELPSHFCHWHRVERLPIDEQIVEAMGRRDIALKTHQVRATVPKELWPAGRRFCSGCQFMVPLWYTQGSKCHACSSHASYSRHLAETYKISYEFYLQMYNFQGGRCYICRRVPLKRRLAVDHHHETGEVRGLLCSGERSCNHDILGNIKNVDMARRIVTYLEDPPARALKEGRDLPLEVASAGAGVMAGRSRTILPNDDSASRSGTVQVMARMGAEAIESRARLAKERHYSDGDFWRFPKGTVVFDIFHAEPDKLDPKVWTKRLELARERQAKIAAQRGEA